MRIVIMGTGPFAVPSSQAILNAGHEIPLVVIRPPANAKAPQAPVQAWALAAGLPIYQPSSINTGEAYEQLKQVAPDLFFVCDYGQILSRDCLAVPRLGGINLHGSLLPRHRGAAPVQWTILAGDRQAGISVIHMTPGLDSGPVLASQATELLLDENAHQLEGRLSEMGAAVTMHAIDLLDRWDGSVSIGKPQDRSLATKAPRIAKADGLLDFHQPASQLELRVRAFQPWPGAYGELIFSESKRMALHIRAARAVQSLSNNASPAIGSAWSAAASSLGLVGSEWSAPWDQLLVTQTADGLLVASLVQPAGKRAMQVAEYLRGHPIPGQSQSAARWAN